MPDCQEEAKKLRCRQLELALEGDPLKLGSQDVKELLQAFTPHSIECAEDTLRQLQQRYRFSLRRDDSGMARLTAFVSKSHGVSSFSAEDPMKIALRDGKWPFALSFEMQIDPPLREKVGNEFVLDNARISELALKLSGQLPGKMAVEAASIRFLSDYSDIDECGIICRNPDPTLASFAILVVFKLMGMHCSAYFYQLYLPDQFSVVPTELEDADKKQPMQIKQATLFDKFADQIKNRPQGPQLPALTTYWGASASSHQGLPGQTISDLSHSLREYFKAQSGHGAGR